MKSKGRIIFIEPGAVVTVHAEGNYTLLQQETCSLLLREPISILERKLRDYGFSGSIARS